jgi:hypothetical protein
MLLVIRHGILIADDRGLNPAPIAANQEEELDIEVLQQVDWEPIGVRHGPSTYKYKCPHPTCNQPMLGSKNGMRAHINRTHLLLQLHCEKCAYSNFNPDLLTHHRKHAH